MTKLSKKQIFPFLPFFMLLIVGFVVHFQTLKFGLFGDDWLAIFWYKAKDVPTNVFSHLPGIFKYLSGHGFLVLFTGVAYDIFGKNYFYYYLLSLIFKIFASFSIFLLIRSLIDKPSHRLSDNLLPFLGAILLLVGVTGIQNTDYIVLMAVFLAAALSFLSIYFLIKATRTKSILFLSFSILLGIFSIIIVPIRLFSFLLTFPISFILIYFLYGSSRYKKLIYIGLFSWIFIIIILWYIGLFFAPGQITSTYMTVIQSSFNALIYHPIQLFSTALQWIGVIIVPSELITDKKVQMLIGFLFILFSLVTFFRIRKNKKDVLKLSISAMPFVLSFIFMFAYSFNRFMASEDRYLVMIFYNFCLFFTLAISYLPKAFYKFALSILVILISVHTFSLQMTYGSWLSNGRGSEFISKTEKVLAQDFNQPINSKKIIFLDFDNGKTLYYIQFGLAFKQLVLTDTFYENNIPDVQIDKEVLINLIKKTPDSKRKMIIESMYSYTLKNKSFYSSTQLLRDEFSSLIDDPI